MTVCAVWWKEHSLCGDEQPAALCGAATREVRHEGVDVQTQSVEARASQVLPHTEGSGLHGLAPGWAAAGEGHV